MLDISNNPNNVEENVKSLKTHGVTVLKKVLTEEQVNKYRNLIQNYFSDGNNRCPGYGKGTDTIKPDAINDLHFKELLDLLDNKKMMDVLRAATENKLRWVHHFDIHMNFTGATGWHSDAQLMMADKDYDISDEPFWIDSEDTYNVYRIAIYLQDHSKDKGGLFVRLGSHTDKEEYYDEFGMKEYYIGTELGDVILFDARLKHKGGNYYDGDRCSIYAAIGKDNDWSKVHGESAILRQTKQNKQDKYFLQDYVEQKLDKLNIIY